MHRVLSSNWKCASVVILFGVAAMLPAAFFGIPSGPDLRAHLRVAMSYDEAIRSGELHPGWLAGSNDGYGDTSFRVYPPGLYYLLVAARALTGDWYAGFILTFTLLSVIGGLGAYFWARALSSQEIAMWAGVLYTLAPYHITEFYQSALLAEYAGGAALAFAFGYTERVCQRGRACDIAGLAASLAALVLTHIPMTMMGALALCVYTLFQADRRNFIPSLARLAAGVLLGALASACYWVTLISELHWVKGDTIQPGQRYNYRSEFLFSTFSTENLNVWYGNIVAVATLALIWPGLIPACNAGQQKRSSQGLKLLAALSLLMTTPLSQPLWMVIPKLGSIEFPWRWLAVTSIVGAVAVAVVIPWWIREARGGRRPLALLAAGSALIALSFTLSNPIRDAFYLSRPQFNDLIRSLPGSQSLEEWIPMWAKSAPRDMKSDVEVTSRSCQITSWESEKRTFVIGPGNTTEARIRTFFYPHWVATADNRPLPLRPDGDGALLVNLPPNRVSVTLEFREPARTRIAECLSVVGWMSIGCLVMLDGWMKRRTSL
jgi:4-amino-4-deoxy-L-arabinose transferase-like glycosyltransferase